MADVLAVYSQGAAVSGKQLAVEAAGDGIQLRFLAMGGAIPADPGSFQRSLRLAGSGAALIVGATESDTESLTKFDDYVETRNRSALTEALNAGILPWIELLTSEFNYESHLEPLKE